MRGRYVPLEGLVIDLAKFGDVSGIRLTAPHIPRDLQDLTQFFVLLDGIYEDCFKLAVLDRVSIA